MKEPIQDLADQSGLTYLKVQSLYDQVCEAEEAQYDDHRIKAKAAVARALARELHQIIAEMDALIVREARNG